MFPTVTVSGSPYACGRLYGTQARDRIERSIAAYADVFRDVVGWDWRQVTTHARRFWSPIRDFDERYAEELVGIADGGRLQRDDILAINLRTEILLSAQVQAALAAHRGPQSAHATTARAPNECTTFARVTPDGAVLAGQNWDWMPFARDTVVVLQSEPDEGPAFHTVVEAGLLAKFGVNSAGVAVLTNALATSEDHGEPGVPYHVLLRALLSCTSTAAGIDVLAKAARASSANYLLADKSGDIVDLEARPGGPDRLHALRPDERGVLVHTNHFASGEFDGVDYADLVESTSHFRLDRARELISQSTGPGEGLHAAVLSDHADAPGSICRHPVRSLPMVEQVETVASALIDPASGSMALSEGPPCKRGYKRLSISRLSATTG